MELTKEICQAVGRRGRFIRYSAERQAYEELSHLEARDKTSHALRTACKRVSNEQKKLSSAPSQANAAASPVQQTRPGIVHPLPHHPQTQNRPRSIAAYPSLEHQFQPIALHEDTGRLDDSAEFGDLLAWFKDPVQEGSE